MRRLLPILLLSAATCLAHPGGLDKQGGHCNNKTGQYHYHRQAQTDQDVGRVVLPESTREARIRSYFDAANSGVTSIGGKVKRDVPG